MHYAILQKWKGDKTFSLLFQAPENKKEECVNTFNRLKREAHKKKLPVEYKMDEFSGDCDAPITQKENEKRKLIISEGRFKGLEFYLEKDEEDEEK